MHPEQAARRGQYDSMETLKDRFDAYMESLTANAPASFINEKRAAILSRCRKMAESLPGFFSLTVPTGGGKTLASMAWALLHAVRYKKKTDYHRYPLYEYYCTDGCRAPGYFRSGECGGAS